jgi:hypothetical protein
VSAFSIFILHFVLQSNTKCAECFVIPLTSSSAIRAKKMNSVSQGGSAEEAKQQLLLQLDSNDSVDVNTGEIFDWTNFTSPEEYVWYLKPTKAESSLAADRMPGQEDIIVNLTAPITIIAVFFFLPLFSAELFFAISRQFICASPYTSDLCSAVLESSEGL